MAEGHDEARLLRRHDPCPGGHVAMASPFSSVASSDAGDRPRAGRRACAESGGPCDRDRLRAHVDLVAKCRAADRSCRQHTPDRAGGRPLEKTHQPRADVSLVHIDPPRSWSWTFRNDQRLRRALSEHRSSVRSRSASRAASKGFLKTSLTWARSTVICEPSSGSTPRSRSCRRIPDCGGDSGRSAGRRSGRSNSPPRRNRHAKLSAWMPASKPRCGNLDLERLLDGQLLLQVLDQDLVLADEQHLRHGFVLEVAQRHAVLLEELDQGIPGNAPILRIPGRGSP